MKFLNKQDGNEEERVSDTNFKIVGRETKKYHWECQSSTDSSMLVRFLSMIHRSLWMRER